MVCILLCYIFSVNCAIKHVLNSTNVSVSVKNNIFGGFNCITKAQLNSLYTIFELLASCHNVVNISIRVC